MGMGADFISALIDWAFSDPFPGRTFTDRNLFADG